MKKEILLKLLYKQYEIEKGGIVLDWSLAKEIESCNVDNPANLLKKILNGLNCAGFEVRILAKDGFIVYEEKL